MVVCGLDGEVSPGAAGMAAHGRVGFCVDGLGQAGEQGSAGVGCGRAHFG